MDKKENNKSSSVVPTRWNRKFGERLAVRRKEFGMYQPDLARKTGISIRAIQNYENGKIPIGRYLKLLAEGLECTAGWLLMGEGPKPGPPGQKIDRDKPPSIYKVGDLTDQVAVPEKDYDLHGGWTPRPEMQDEDHNLLGKAFEIIRSKSIYREALAANITAFYGALESEKELLKTKKELENTIKIQKDQADEIDSLKKTCGELLDRISALEMEKTVEGKKTTQT